jgi:hypothetical protein
VSARAASAPALPPPLLQRALHGLTLDDAPFDCLGAPLGLGGDAVIDALRQWLNRGVIVRIGPVFAGRGAPPITGAWGRALQAASASGLPLVRQPYEALGAMLGAPATQVQAQLAEWLARGQLLRIAAVPALSGR